MKKSTLTEDKAEQTPIGGVLVGKRKGQTIIHNKGTLSGYLVGKTHDEGGIKAVNKSTGQALEMQGGEVVITAPAVSDNTKNEFNGKMMTNREVLSAINEKGGGVSFAKGGDIPKNIKRTGASYKYGGKTMTDHEIYKKITGGHLAEGMTLSQIAKKHNISLKDLQRQVDMGMKAESEHTSSKREQMNIVKDHLFENPKYYSLLKKAGLKHGGLTLNGFDVDYFETKRGIYANLEIPSQNPTFEDDIQIKGFGKTEKEAFKDLKKELEIYLKKSNYKHGGRVHRGSLVRDAKSGNTPARDLNNYNDMLDVEADGKVGGDTGLFANGGTVKPYDANMEGDSADMVYARGGATDVIVNNWSEVPDSFKNVRLPKKVEWSAYPSNEGLNEIVKPFLGVEDLRPAMQGINFDNNGITVTNAHILLTIPTNEHDFQGVYKKVKGQEGFDKLDEKYPNYAQVIPKQEDSILSFYIDIEKLLTYCKIASNYSGSQEVVFKINEEQMSFFPDLMIGFLSSLIKLTGRLNLNVSFTTNKKSLVFSKYPAYFLSKDEIGLIMPYVYGSGKKLGTRNEDKKAELNVYYDFDDNEIRNSDGSVVTDWKDKPKKERAKRTPKTTASKTSVPIDLIDKKIWVEDNPDLSRRVQELALANGFVNDKGTVVKNTDYSSIYLVKRATGQKYFYVFNYDKTDFDKEPETEIFESDLFPIKTPTKETEKIEVFKLIGIASDGISSTTGIYGATELLQNIKLLESKFSERQNFTYRIYDFMGKEYDTLNIGRGIRTPAELITYIMSKPYYKDYDWDEFFAFGTEITLETTGKFTDAEIDMFNQIDAIVNMHDITKVSITEWGDGSTTTDFDIVNTLTGEVFGLRKYNKSLGVQKEDVDIEKSRALIRKYKEFKKLTPTKDVEKQEEKVEVWKLYPVSEDGQHTSDFGLYSASQLLDYLIDSYSQFPQRDFFEFKIVDQNGKTYDNVTFLKNLLNFTDLVAFIYSRKEFTDKYDWEAFNLYQAPETIVEQPKPSQTEKPKRNFELERKYLSQRISDLAKELDLKKPILSNEEVAFYQREINSFILKLRKLNDAEMSLKPIEERVRGVYGLKFASFDNEYTETEMTSINALKSQLTEKEYFNVRTPEFKSFFGDWETAYLNDSYAGVSKVINPITKEPQPVFHGTNVLFVNWKTYDTNNAHYFAVKREFSEFFATSWESRSDKAGVDSEILKKLNPNKGNFLLRCFIDVKNPIDFSRFGVEKYPIREFLTFLRVNYNIGDFDFWTNITSHSGFTQDTEVYAWQIIRLWQSFTKYVKVFTTYDGYIFYEYIPTKPYGGLENASLSYCAFDSNQIKFTDAYEFNALSNDSRFDLGGIL